MANVVVVRQGDKYSIKYPQVLKRQVEKNTRWPVAFHILGDGEDATTRLKNGWPGWWSKLELFAPWNDHLRPCLFLDLDTFVLGNIDDLVSLVPAKLTMLRDFNRHETGQSAVMSIPQDVGMIWRRFIADPEGWMKKFKGGGDQSFLNRFDLGFLQDSFDGIASYKVDDLQNGPKGNRIVCWHGKPKPHECGGWVREVWNGRYNGHQDVSVPDAG
ncbi:MAG: hypothetical protein ACR2OV_15860 [Hyphomicrobiaceae bacterium]